MSKQYSYHFVCVSRPKPYYMRRSNAGNLPADFSSLNSQFDKLFEPGKCYKILCRQSTDNGGGIRGDAWINVMTGNGCVFRFDGKQGIHYCFREIYGGWHRTFTASQLIGKKILEAKS